MNHLTVDVTKGLLEASSQAGFAGISMGVYRLAESKKDTATMDRAMGYAADAVGNAAESAKEVGDALEEAQIAASEEEKAIEKAAIDTQQESGGTVREPGAGDTMEISTEGRARAEAEPAAMPESYEGDVSTRGNSTAPGEPAAPKLNIHA